jgi:Fe-S oxidoreductase
VTYHDPCYLGRYADTHEEPRQLLSRFGADVKEPVRNRDNPFCCGAGGGLLFEEHESGKRISQERFEQLQATGAGTVVMACPVLLDHAQGRQVQRQRRRADDGPDDLGRRPAQESGSREPGR